MDGLQPLKVCVPTPQGGISCGIQIASRSLPGNTGSELSDVLDEVFTSGSCNGGFSARLQLMLKLTEVVFGSCDGTLTDQQIGERTSTIVGAVGALLQENVPDAIFFTDCGLLEYYVPSAAARKDLGCVQFAISNLDPGQFPDTQCP